MSEEKISSYSMYSGNPYQWCLEQAGAEVLAFQDFGSYQGDWFAKVKYNDQIGWIQGSYGSCSGCDAFEAESGWDDRTKEEWLKFAGEFGKPYLNDIQTYEQVLKSASQNLSWDTDAKEMVEWLEVNK